MEAELASRIASARTRSRRACTARAKSMAPARLRYRTWVRHSIQLRATGSSTNALSSPASVSSWASSSNAEVGSGSTASAARASWARPKAYSSIRANSRTCLSVACSTSCRTSIPNVSATTSTSG